MRPILCVLLATFFLSAQAQRPDIDFSDIDERVSTLDASTPDSLALLLTQPYTGELQKVRAIFSWIADHISYSTATYNTRFQHPRCCGIDPLDTISVWRSGAEMTAWRVLQRRNAVCEGYAQLFMVLCRDAGLQAEVISGYARCGLERSDRFRTNHSWNAVRIDSHWYLVDMTWASGYIGSNNEYVARLDESYFLTPPRLFVRDHYPEDLRWTLLQDPPALREFAASPFRCKSFIKYGIHSYKPGNGTIEAAVGDTVQLELEISDAFKNKSISSDPFFDSTMLTTSPSSVFLAPSFQSRKVVYTYVVSTERVEWLNLLYNDDVVLRYQLRSRMKD